METKHEDWARIARGPHFLFNNTWGRAGNAEGGQQSISGPEMFSWGWDWQRKAMNPDRGEPIGYPAVITGKRVWENEASTTTALPVPVSQIADLSINHAYELDAAGRYNVSVNLWLRDPASDAIAEILLMRERSARVYPHSDKRLGTLGAQEVHQGTRHGPTQWEIYSFVSAPPPQRSGSIDLLQPIQWLCAQGLLHPNWLLSCVEFGTEVWEGRGQLKLSTYQLVLNSREVA